MFARLGPAVLAWSLLVSCVVGGGPDEDQGDVGDPEQIIPPDDQSEPPATGELPAGSYARVCNASALNQRSEPNTTASVLKVIPSGSSVKIMGFAGGWYQNDWNGSIGWSSGTYLCAAEPTTTDSGAGFASTDISRTSFLSISRASTGFSYYWGGARLAQGGAPGSCSGSCPSCTHSGSYGADCSGFIAKAWLLPAALPMDANLHPYTTASFAGSHSLWSSVARSSLMPGDALVMRTSSSGHIVLYEKDDPWGSFWAYEARGCSYGIVHNIRTAGSAYQGIRRTGV